MKYALNNFIHALAVACAMRIGRSSGLDETYQLVGFHPDFVFGGIFALHPPLLRPVSASTECWFRTSTSFFCCLQRTLCVRSRVCRHASSMHDADSHTPSLRLFGRSGTDARDASNWVNRSPYPMVHILRQDSVTQAVTDKPGLQVGLMNKHNLRSLAVKGKLQELLQGTPGVAPAAIANIRVCQEASGRPLDGEANYLYYDDTETDT
eukprot:6185494-Pleurochrysis_carterae.AAC.2